MDMYMPSLPAIFLQWQSIEIALYFWLGNLIGKEAKQWVYAHDIHRSEHILSHSESTALMKSGNGL